MERLISIFPRVTGASLSPGDGGFELPLGTAIGRASSTNVHQRSFICWPRFSWTSLSCFPAPRRSTNRCDGLPACCRWVCCCSPPAVAVAAPRLQRPSRLRPARRHPRRRLHQHRSPSPRPVRLQGRLQRRRLPRCMAVTATPRVWRVPAAAAAISSPTPPAASGRFRCRCGCPTRLRVRGPWCCSRTAAMRGPAATS